MSSIPVGTVVEVTTENGGRISGVLLGRADTSRPSFVAVEGGYGSDIPRCVRLDTGTQVVEVGMQFGPTIKSLTAVAA